MAMRLRIGPRRRMRFEKRELREQEDGANGDPGWIRLAKRRSGWWHLGRVADLRQRRPRVVHGSL